MYVLETSLFYLFERIIVCVSDSRMYASHTHHLSGIGFCNSQYSPGHGIVLLSTK